MSVSFIINMYLMDTQVRNSWNVNRLYYKARNVVRQYIERNIVNQRKNIKRFMN